MQNIWALAIPLNPEKGNIFEYRTCGILVLKPMGQHELHWWMTIMNSFSSFSFIRVFVISRLGGILHLNSLSMYNVGDHSHSPNLLWNLWIFLHHVSVLYEIYLWIFTIRWDFVVQRSSCLHLCYTWKCRVSAALFMLLWTCFPFVSSADWFGGMNGNEILVASWNCIYVPAILLVNLSACK